MKFEVVGWWEDDPQLNLDHGRFSYAGKFVMTNTGKAVAREDGEVVAAVAFNADRTDEAMAWLRYITVRTDFQGAGIGPKLADFAVEKIRSRSFERVRIAVNNPFAYEAMYKVGFGYTGEATGLAELVLERPRDRDPEEYHAGLREFAARDVPENVAIFVRSRLERGTLPSQSEPEG